MEALTSCSLEMSARKNRALGQDAVKTAAEFDRRLAYTAGAPGDERDFSFETTSHEFLQLKTSRGR